MNILVLDRTGQALLVGDLFASHGCIVKAFSYGPIEYDKVIPIESWRGEVHFADFIVTDDPILAHKAQGFSNMVPILAVDTGIERETLGSALALIPAQQVRLIAKLLTPPNPKFRRWWMFWRRDA